MPIQDPTTPETSSGAPTIRQDASTPTAMHDPIGRHQPLDDDPWLDEPGQLPRRPRRRLLAPKPLALLGVLLLACGFIAGALIEKGQTTSGTGTGFSATAAGSHGTAPTAAGFAKARAAASGSTTTETGEVSYIRDGTVYLKDSEDNTVKVTAGAGATVTKTITTKADKIHPGETVTVSGTKASSGTITAKTITVGSTGVNGGLPTGSTTSKSTTSRSEPALFGE